MSEIRIVRDYRYPVARVWRALTDPDLIPLWTTTGAGAHPEGFAPVPGTKFRFVAKPKPGWNGIVNCEVLEAREPTLLRYTWTDDGGGDDTEVAYRLQPWAAAPASPMSTPVSRASAAFSWPRCQAGSAARCSAPACPPSSPTSATTADFARKASCGLSPEPAEGNARFVMPEAAIHHADQLGKKYGDHTAVDHLDLAVPSVGDRPGPDR
jgi:uncharacterized protein YndB with AHSA1/START domain